jgi:intracellular septation protein
MKIAIKLALEFCPLILFLIFTFTHDVFVGTAWLMGATVVAMAAVWYLYRRVALMALINAVTGLISGAMTLYFTDPTYVKMKPTIISGLYAAIMAVGLLTNRPLLKALLGEELHLQDKGWKVITSHCALYFVFIAILNEVIWRHFSTEFWAGFKVFGLIPLSIVFAVAMIPLARRYRDPSAPHDPEFDSIADYLDGGATQRKKQEEERKRLEDRDRIERRAPLPHGKPVVGAERSRS